MTTLKATLACLGALALAAPAGCKKKDEKEPAGEKTAPKETTPKEPPPKPRTVAEVAGDCWAAIKAHDEAKLKACYGSDAAFSVVDYEPPTSGGADAAVAFYKAMWTTFPELDLAARLTLINGNKMASVLIAKGIDEGGVMGAEPSGKSYTGAHATLFELGESGTIKRHASWIDQATLLAQLGHHPDDTAPKAEPAWDTIAPVTATDSAVEKKNVETITAHIGRLGGGVKAADASIAYAENATFRYIPEAKAHAGTEAVTARIGEYLAPNSELSVKVVEIWAAGNWVVARTQTSATIAKGLEGAEALGGKTWRGEYLELYELEADKIKTEYIFANNLRFETDLGLFDPKSVGAKTDEQ